MATEDHPSARDWQNRAERAEAECKELRERVAEHRTALLVSRAFLQIAKGQFDDPAAFKSINDAIALATITLETGESNVQ